MQVVARAKNQTWRFETQPGEKVLHAGLRSGLDLPYECASGTCGTCKARLIEGEIEDQWPEAPGKQYLKVERREFLMCQCLPRTDCVVEIARAVPPLSPDAPRPSCYTGVVRQRQLLTHDVALVEIEPDRPVEFEAGQFMLVTAPGVPGGRAYSMIDYERPASRLRFVIKRKPGGGFTEWLFGTEVGGTRVGLVGPLGHATFDPGVEKPLLCIAGGTGIAGILSVLARGEQERYFDRYDARLFFGVRTARDVFLLERLRDLKRQFAERFHVTVALSDETPPVDLAAAYPEFVFDVGLVHQVAGRAIQGRLNGVRVYLAGPPPMVEASLRMLVLEAKVPPTSILYDKFS